jgi:hypothetical protein
MEISALDRGAARLATDADGQNPALQAEGLMAALGCSMVRR